MPELDIIVPIKNEERNIPALVRRIDSAMKKAAIDYRVIAVDDHSSDRTKDVLEELKKTYPVTVCHNDGLPGKAYAILVGAKSATSEYIAMIDADLQYAPDAIPQMLTLTPLHGVVVGNRRTYRGSFFRKLASRLNALVFGKALLGLSTDVQSGLKIVRRDIFEHLDLRLVSPWAIDMPLLYTARELGYTIGEVDIVYTKRKNGQSKIQFIKSALEIAGGALKVRLSSRKVYHLRPASDDSMRGAGVVYRRKRFITHSTLPDRQSAIVTFGIWQKVILADIAIALVIGFLLNAHLTAVVLIAILSTIYFIDVLFNLVLVVKSLRHEPQVTVPESDIKKLADRDLPIYSILCPLYREAGVLSQFLDGLRTLDWPKEKLDVQLLLEEDDIETIGAVRGMELPAYVRMTIVPHSQPKTKPKACNYGLNHARGEYVVIYDAEDVPDPMQLKKAYLAFQSAPENIFCLQAKLNYYNPQHNLLTRLFTAEYSLWFDVILPGLQSIETSIPLGGTSNHFRTQNLKMLHGWDPFNVTEDCDLGVRLFKAGFRTAIIDSTTMEEANSNVWNWLRQRSRWIKGYMQTYLVHMRNPIEFVRERGIHALLFQLTIGGKLAFMLINPILWLATVSYFTLYTLVGPTIESLYPTSVFYMAAFSLVFGNFLYLYYYMIGTVKREHWSVVKYVFLIPFYWLMVSIGAGIAFVQLLFKPYYWEKTHHGLHAIQEERRLMHIAARREQIERAKLKFAQLQQLVLSGAAAGGMLVAASLVANIVNYVYNAYLGRSISEAEFGLVSLIGNFLFFSQIAFGALSATVTHRSAYLYGKFGKPARSFWEYVRKRSIRVVFLIALLWVISSPVLQVFFQANSVVPFLLFTPVWIVGAFLAIDGGFLSGNLMFRSIAVLTVIAPIAKLLFAAGFISFGMNKYVYAAIPLSLIVSYLFTHQIAASVRRSSGEKKIEHILQTFPRKFFLTSVLLGLSDIAFLSIDVILAKHYLNPTLAGQYALLSIAGKIIFFLGSLFSSFINPVVSNAEGANQNSHAVFRKLLLATGVASSFGYLAIGVLGRITVPILFGIRSIAILPLLPIYGLSMALVAIGSSILSFHQARKEYFFSAIGFSFAIAQVAGIMTFHSDIGQISSVVFIMSSMYLSMLILSHIFYRSIVDIGNNAIDFFGLLKKFPSSSEQILLKPRILIMNWRDTKHVWAGGAEVYVHELAKRWVAKGYKVTVFCGNDGNNPRNEIINGIQIVRRGGFFTVYFWGFLYYLLKFRSCVDVIIDCENGIPFFTPLYSRKRKFLVVHHIHQDVFRKGLRPPFSWIASFLELRAMPLVYRNTKMITVSPSSKADILNLGLSRQEPEIVYNGVDRATYKPGKKSTAPLVLYLGRLRFYKSLDVFIRAAKQVIEKLPAVLFVIAGEGEEKQHLVELAKQLGIEKSISFVGKVSEVEKIKLYQKAWVFVNPSLVEGWGITTIEANACGVPVVASNVAGLRDSVYNPHSGILIPYGNVQEFADTISQLITNSRMREQMSREAIKWANRFEWSTSADSMLKLIQN